MASPSTVITLGYGSFGSLTTVILLGLGIGESVAPGEPPVLFSDTIDFGHTISDRVDFGHTISDRVDFGYTVADRVNF